MRDLINDSLTPTTGETWQEQHKMVQSNVCMIAPTVQLRVIVDKFASEISKVTSTIKDPTSLETAIRQLNLHFSPIADAQMGRFITQMDMIFPKGPTPTFEEFYVKGQPDMVVYIAHIRSLDVMTPEQQAKIDQADNWAQSDHDTRYDQFRNILHKETE